MKSLTSLWSITANELAVRCCTSAIRDITTVSERAEHEGLSFFAITLASYGKAIEKWLDQGFVVPSDCPSFGRNRRTGLPAFLQGFLGRVFSTTSGVLLDDPDIEAVYAIRQLTLSFSKIALPHDFPQRKSTSVVTPRRERLAMSSFIQCEKDIRRSDSLLDPQYLTEFKEMSELLFGQMFSKLDRDVYWQRLKPKHGPGAVADRLSSNAKYRMRTWTSRLERVMPAADYLIPNHHFRDEMDKELNVLEPGAEIPVRVITVPKTLKAPRIIAIEPAAMQYAQQALLECITSAIREDGILSRIIGLDDQTPNRVMAMKGSLSGELATLDLSEASDRVSYQHVRAMIENYPDLLGMVDACRSRKADVPGHGVIRLSKFASMGSALCFPFEAMVFATLAFLGIQRELSSPLTRHQLIKLADKVRVFGDDIIVPRDSAVSVVDELHLFGYVVNTGKSFWTGRFRESCGKEYYDGHDVSIVKLRRVLPTRRTDAEGVISAFSFRNQCYFAGLWKTAAWMDDYLARVVKHVPVVAPSSPLLGRNSFLGYQTDRMDPNYHSPLTKGYSVVAKPPLDPLEGVGALHKCLMDRNWTGIGLKSYVRPYCPVDVASVDEGHLERSGRPKHVNIKLGWKSPF
ncbi:RNA-directed RNA polymerase [ssRNA phage Zoerhiza.4_3]|uniref:RNA-directed RNA polymerase n=2 Tax=Leviviricetes TaxID=2842243 RepID=A0A8S5KYA4_9VIRU|nr:RNA-directed RNA polymerase [ssRNA phage Zoerhiza.4_3]QDH89177.1 MAG: RNA-dependent RNA polymerase [Leviviridae sp.]DAD50029.1 TPA_asm: RNA-directed RNA polymerase [ssRNA phage Zoerhiza.4_3]